MVGGGHGAFIGAIHRTAIEITGSAELVAGAFSADAERAMVSAVAIGIDKRRAYHSWRAMISSELALPVSERIGAVSIVTPNHLHAPIAVAALQAGFHVICEKPLADSLQGGLAIEEAAKASGKVFALTHTYLGYPLVRQARSLITSGEFGQVRRVTVGFTQDWLSLDSDGTASKQAEWRLDPQRAGLAGAFGDIGSHAASLTEFITGRRISRLCADLRALPGRNLDDDGACLFELEGGGKGTLVASQICTGDINELLIAVYCERGAVHWRQMTPNTLRVSRRGQPDEIWHAGNDRPYLPQQVRSIQRLPGGHPEGYIEALANQYGAFVEDIRSGGGSDAPVYATIEDGLAGMRFIAAAIASNADGSWVSLRGS